MCPAKFSVETCLDWCKPFSWKSVSPNENLIELLLSLLFNILLKHNDGLPSNIVEKLLQITNLIPKNNGPDTVPTVEL